MILLLAVMIMPLCEISMEILKGERFRGSSKVCYTIFNIGATKSDKIQCLDSSGECADVHFHK